MIHGRHPVLLSGNDQQAKVMDLPPSFCWKEVLDLGDITSPAPPILPR